MNKLENILSHKKEAVARRMKDDSVLKTRTSAESMPPALDFRSALLSSDGKTRIIAEVKKTSPTADFGGDSIDAVSVAKGYESAGASAISVLTEEKFFSGSLSDLIAIKDSVGIPILCKDFIVDPYQIFEARAAGADAVLLIAAILDSYELKDFITISRQIGINPLVEITDRPDAEKALICEIDIIGINCRNLKTFETNKSVFEELHPLIPDDILVVAESGIKSRSDLLYINNLGIYSVLIGSMFMETNDPGAALGALLGDNDD